MKKIDEHAQIATVAHCEPRSGDRLGNCAPFSHMGDLPACAWFEVAENLAFDVLIGTSFINCSIRGIFCVRAKNRVLALLTSDSHIDKIKVNAKTPHAEVAGLHTVVDRSTLNEEHYLHRIARQVMIHVDWYPAALVSGRAAGLLNIETHLNVVESRCFMTAEGLMDILPEIVVIRLYYKPNGKTCEFAKFVIVTSAFSALSCIIHICDDEERIAEIRVQASTECDLTSSVQVAHYKALQHPEEQVDRPDEVKKLQGNANCNAKMNYKCHTKMSLVVTNSWRSLCNLKTGGMGTSG